MNNKKDDERGAMHQKLVKKYICDELSHGRPLQHILNPAPPQVQIGVEDGQPIYIDDPDWKKPALPKWTVVVAWLGEDEEFAHAFEVAEKYGAKWLADEMLVLKDKVKSDPRNATAYRTAMEMIKWATMIRDPKYSERTIQEIKNTTPRDPLEVKARIAQIEEELGLKTIDVPVTEVKKEKVISEKQRAHLERARALLAEKKRLQSGESDELPSG